MLNIGYLVTRGAANLAHCFGDAVHAMDVGLAEQATARKQQMVTDAAAHPLVQRVLEQFPGAELRDVREAANG